MTDSINSRIDYWAGVAGRGLTDFEQMLVARPFRWQPEQRRLSRLLKPLSFGTLGGYVELDLTVNQHEPRFDFALAVHGTRFGVDKDKFLHDVPAHERQYMSGLHGHEVTQWVLYGDVWSQIDLNRLHYLNGWLQGTRSVRLAEVLPTSDFAELLREGN